MREWIGWVEAGVALLLWYAWATLPPEPQQVKGLRRLRRGQQRRVVQRAKLYVTAGFDVDAAVARAKRELQQEASIDAAEVDA